MVAPAPVVTDQAAVFHDLFDHPCQFRHFQPYLGGPQACPSAGDPDRPQGAEPPAYTRGPGLASGGRVSGPAGAVSDEHCAGD
jgi:hypothetical protein